MASSNGISWDNLKAGIAKAFEGDKVSVDEVKKLMSSYEANRSDWLQYEHFDKHKYTRNLVDEGNGKYNLIVLCWDSGQGSSIHDHAGSHCFMKTLQGHLRETLYDWPEGVKKESEVSPMTIRETFVYGAGDVTYINNSMGLHRVENHTHTDRAITLHLYSPPIRMCKCFEERTGTSHECSVTFYTTPN